MKTLFRTLAAFVMAAGFSVVASAQSVYLSTYSKMDFSKVKETTATVRLNRDFYAGYNTLCLPFSVSADNLRQLMGEGVMLERLVNAENGQLTFMDVTDQGVEAGMPYLIYAPARATVTFSTTDLNLVQQPQVVRIGQASMVGNFEPAQHVNMFGIPAQQDTDLLQSVLVRTEGDKTFLPTRCGIKYEGTETPVILHVTSMEGEVTAIKALQAQNALVDVYTPGGKLVRKAIGMKDAMNSLKSGIYVVNGMKFMVVVK